MKTAMNRQTAVKNCKSEDIMDEFLANTFRSSVVIDACAGNDKILISPLKLPIEDQNLTNYNHGLVALNNLVQNNTKLDDMLHFDHKSNGMKYEKNLKPHCIMRLNDPVDKAKEKSFENLKLHCLMPLNDPADKAKDKSFEDSKLHCLMPLNDPADKAKEKSFEDSKPHCLMPLNDPADKAKEKSFEDSKPHCLMPLSDAAGKAKDKSFEDSKLCSIMSLDRCCEKAEEKLCEESKLVCVNSQIEKNKSDDSRPLCCQTGKAESNEGFLIDVTDLTVEGKNFMAVHPLKNSDSVNFNASALPSLEAIKKVACIQSEDLISCFSEMCLSEKPSGDELSAGFKVSSNNLCRNKTLPVSSSHGKMYHETFPHTHGEYVEDNLFSKQNVCENISILKPVAENKNSFDHVGLLKLKSATENDLFHSDDNQSDDEFLIERGGVRKKVEVKQKEQKIALSKTKMSNEEWTRHLKHMSGGSVLGPSLFKTFNISGGCYNKSVAYRPGYDNDFMECNSQSSLQVCSDQNIIHPIRQVQSCRSDNVHSLTSLHCSNDINGSPLSYNDSNSFASIPNGNTMLGMQSQQNVPLHSPCSDMSNSRLVDIDDVMNSPTSDLLSYQGQNSRSTSPESGYGSSPRLSPFSDDGNEIRKHQDQLTSNRDSYFDDLCSLSHWMTPTQSIDEGVDDLDLSLLDDIGNSTSCGGHQCTEEENEKIKVIVQDLKKCEEFVKPHSTDVGDKFSSCQQSMQYPSSNANAPYSQESFAPTNIPLQQGSPVSVGSLSPMQPTQSGNLPPQMIVICVPYVPNSTERRQTNFKPILPKPPEQQPHQVESCRDRLKKTLNFSKLMLHEYAIYGRIGENEKNVIFTEDPETRQTNLHIAVIKQDVELAFTILEIHKQYNKNNNSAVNKRDIYKKTALEYVNANMTLFMEYMKDYGAK